LKCQFYLQVVGYNLKHHRD